MGETGQPEPGEKPAGPLRYLKVAFVKCRYVKVTIVASRYLKATFRMRAIVSPGCRDTTTRMGCNNNKRLGDSLCSAAMPLGLPAAWKVAATGSSLR